LPGVIVKRSLHDEVYWYKIGVAGGILENSYRREDLRIELNCTPAQIGIPDIVHLYETDTLKVISLRTAMTHVSVGGGQGHFCCKCTKECNTKTCKCFKAGIKCGSKCHKNNQLCTNKCIQVIVHDNNDEEDVEPIVQPDDEEDVVPIVQPDEPLIVDNVDLGQTNSLQLPGTTVLISIFI
jgi:hypothetical protein